MKCQANGCQNDVIKGRDGCHNCLVHPDSPIVDYDYIDSLKKVIDSLFEAEIEN